MLTDWRLEAIWNFPIPNLALKMFWNNAFAVYFWKREFQQFSLSFHVRFVAHQKLYDMFIFDNSCLIYEKDISLHYTIGKFIISILRIRCKGNITIILKQTAKALLHLCHSECLVNLQKSKHQHSTASPPIINHFEMKL